MSNFTKTWEDTDMWVRSELKARARAAFKRNYWKCVLVAFILALLMGSFSLRSSRSSNSSTEMTPEERQFMMEMSEELNELGDKPFVKSYFSIMSKNLKLLSSDLFRSDSRVGISLGGLGLVGLVLSVLVFNPLVVGCRRFYLVNSQYNAKLSELGAGFKGNWGNVIWSCSSGTCSPSSGPCS